MLIKKSLNFQGPPTSDQQSLAFMLGTSITNIQKSVDVDVLQPSNERFQKILLYVVNSQCHKFKADVKRVFKIRRHQDVKHGRGKRMLLWHGTTKDAVASILVNGFRRPTSHGMFGNGIYFADRFSKSAQYCQPKSAKNNHVGSVGYLLLCDVKLDRMYEDTSYGGSKYTNPPLGYDSIKGVGKYEPEESQQQYLNGSIMPLGSTRLRWFAELRFALKYNEYVVYDVNKIVISYVVEVEFK